MVMQDTEFAMAKSLFSSLVVRTRSNKRAEPSSSSSSSKPKASSKSKGSHSNRRFRFDDKSGPPPPRGSLTDEKLSYLDWRLKRINILRQKSEGTPHCWIDGRDTIGRNSIDVGPSCQVARVAVVQEQKALPIPAPAPASVAPVAPVAAAPQTKVKARVPSSIAYVIASEKAAGLKALEHAYAGDSMLASMPRLSKRDSSSGSELSGSSDQHASDEVPAAMLHATSDKDVGGVYFSKPRRSLLAHVGSRLSKNHRKHQEASTLACEKVDVAPQHSTARTHRSISRIWHR